MAASWFDKLLGSHNPPATPAGEKPTSPLTPFPVLGYQALKDPRYDRRFRRFLGYAGQPGLVEIPQVLLPTISLAAFGAEDYYPDDLLMTGQTTQAQVGGAITQIGLVNPAKSGLLFIVDLIVAARLNTAGAVNIRYAAESTITAVLAQSNNVSSRDQRGLGAGGSGNPRLWQGSGAITGSTVGVDFSGVSVNPARIAQGFVVVPGAGLLIASDIVNEGITAGWSWRERPVPTVG